MRAKLFIIFTVIFALALRLAWIELFPVGFTPDEASFGYDAYSILKTGKDQWGNFLPLQLESFGDYKMPLYSYLSLPSVAFFGLNKFAVRLPNVLISVAAVYATYLLVLEFFRQRPERELLAKISALLLALSPWHIMMGRGAFEANLTTFFLPLGTLFFLKGMENKKYMLLSAFVFGLNLFTYHSARLVTPIIVFLLAYLYRQEIGKKLFSYRYALLIFLIFLGSAFFTLTRGSARRAQDITIFSGAVNQAGEERFMAVYQGMSETSARIFHNKFLVIIKRFFTNYSQYFSANFLFLGGPSEGTYGMIPGRGVLYWFEAMFLLGFVYSSFYIKHKKFFLFLVLWLLIAPVPAALTTGRGFAGNRSVIMLPALTIASATGLFVLVGLLRKTAGQKILKTGYLLFLVLITYSFISFFKDYFIIAPYKNSKDMLFGNLEVAYWLKEHSEGKKEIIISRSLSEPHIYIAFANKWDPSDYQKETADWSRYKNEGHLFLDQLGKYKLGKYIFTDIDFKAYQKEKDVLLVGKAGDFPPEAKPVMKYLNPDGSVSVMVVEPFNQAFAAKNSGITEGL